MLDLRYVASLFILHKKRILKYVRVGCKKKADNHTPGFLLPFSKLNDVEIRYQGTGTQKNSINNLWLATDPKEGSAHGCLTLLPCVVIG